MTDNRPSDGGPRVPEGEGRPASPTTETPGISGSEGSTAPAGSPPPPINRSLPPDPAAYDAPRASLARARGLSAPYIAGGRDPEPDIGRREERVYVRLLVVMVVVIVLSGFVLGILGNVLTALRAG